MAAPFTEGGIGRIGEICGDYDINFWHFGGSNWSGVPNALVYRYVSTDGENWPPAGPAIPFNRYAPTSSKGVKKILTSKA